MKIKGWKIVDRDRCGKITYKNRNSPILVEVRDGSDCWYTFFQEELVTKSKVTFLTKRSSTKDEAKQIALKYMRNNPNGK